MNVGVEAGPMSVSVIAKLVAPILFTHVSLNSVANGAIIEWACFSPALSINGHSMNAVNPDSFSFGGVATSIMA